MIEHEPDELPSEPWSELWANADAKAVGHVDMLRIHREAYLRGEVPEEEWEKTVGGVMARGRWMRRQLERADMGYPIEEFDLAAGLEDVERDLQRLNAES